MPSDLIPDDVREFIIRHIDSVAQFEALMLLRGSADQQWDVPAVAKRLYTSEEVAAEALGRLTDDGFLKLENESYRYTCDPERRAAVDRAAAVYARQLISVTRLIHAQPRRIRQFADAFRFRKDR